MKMSNLIRLNAFNGFIFYKSPLFLPTIWGIQIWWRWKNLYHLMVLSQDIKRLDFKQTFFCWPIFNVLLWKWPKLISLHINNSFDQEWFLNVIPRKIRNLFSQMDCEFLGFVVHSHIRSIEPASTEWQKNWCHHAWLQSTHHSFQL